MRKVYYKGWFSKVYEVEVVARQKYATSYTTTPWFEYKYIIKFQNGKTKLVNGNKLIFP